MSLPKFLVLIAFSVFLVIGSIALWKMGKKNAAPVVPSGPIPIVLSKSESAKPVAPAPAVVNVAPKLPVVAPVAGTNAALREKIDERRLPSADRVEDLFNVGTTKFPIVETITYTSKVSWLQGRPAWLVDYANHYATSRHFIARSLNRKPDYFNQKVNEGDRFNVLKQDRDIQFYLLVDATRCHMWFYYLDQGERVLIKDYAVGLGREDHKSPSGCLTPIGRYLLGSKVAIYKPGMMGTFHNQSTEMIRVFGTRWIPFEKEIGDCSAPARGFGLHGAPWYEVNSQLVEDCQSLGHHESDGCIRLKDSDIEEIFSIVITRPTTVEIVKDFFEAQLPGKERQ